LLSQTQTELHSKKEKDAQATELRHREELARQQAREEQLRKQAEHKKKKEASKAASSPTANAEHDTPLAHRELMEKLSAAAPSLPEAAGSTPSKQDAAMQAVKAKEEGNAAFKAKRYDSAISLYGRAIALDPENYVYYLNRAAACLSLETEKTWQQCVEDSSKAIVLVDAQLSKADVPKAVAAKLKSSRTKALFRRASAKAKHCELFQSRKDREHALEVAEQARVDIMQALEAEPTHVHMLKMRTELDAKVKSLKAALQAAASPDSPATLSKRAAADKAKADKAAALAAKARAARRESSGSVGSPAKGDFKAPKTAYAVKQALSSFRHASDAESKQSEYLWQFKVGVPSVLRRRGCLK